MSNKNAERALESGDLFPFDHQDPINGESDVTFDPPLDWAHRAARGVIADLTDRRGIKYGFNNIDEDVRFEIVCKISEIIRAAERLYR